eukprot:TRINITY_DN555_c0_g1_i3.p1 TRINITY_DN555_c0_g1~~TRINITY_DN555_c0_g1_i3.p1  ORF type:complete len:816 (-),score=109.26 TRINITY_DN555_c0_g1_i3:1114-3561(-)
MALSPLHAHPLYACYKPVAFCCSCASMPRGCLSYAQSGSRFSCAIGCDFALCPHCYWSTVVLPSWEWDSNGVWVAFDHQSNIKLSTAELEQNSRLVLTFGSTNYEMNVMNLTQKNLTTQFVRSIRKANSAPVVSLSSITTPYTAPSPTTTTTVCLPSFPSSQGYVNATTVVQPSSITIKTPFVTGDNDPFAPSISYTQSESSESESESEHKKDYTWEYNDLKGGWLPYDQKTQSILEDAWNAGNDKITLTHGFFGPDGYIISFPIGSVQLGNQMNQRTNNRRELRRNPPNNGWGSKSNTAKISRRGSSIAKTSKNSSKSTNSMNSMNSMNSTNSTNSTNSIASTASTTSTASTPAVSPLFSMFKARRGSAFRDSALIDSSTHNSEQDIEELELPTEPEDDDEIFMFLLGKTFNNKDYFPDVEFVFENDQRKLYVHKLVMSAHNFSRAFNLDTKFSEKIHTIKSTKSYDVMFGFFKVLYCGNAIIKTRQICDSMLELAKELQVSVIQDILSREHAFPTIISLLPSKVSLAQKCASYDHSDCTIQVSGTSIPAHRFVLTATSDFFNIMLTGKMRESSTRLIQIGEPWDPVTFGAFLKCLYSMDFKQAIQPLFLFPDAEIDIQQLLEMADIYQQPQLRNMVVTSLLENMDDFMIDAVSAGIILEPIVQKKFGKDWESVKNWAYRHMGASSGILLGTRRKGMALVIYRDGEFTELSTGYPSDEKVIAQDLSFHFDLEHSPHGIIGKTLLRMYGKMPDLIKEIEVVESWHWLVKEIFFFYVIRRYMRLTKKSTICSEIFFFANVFEIGWAIEAFQQLLVL